MFLQHKFFCYSPATGLETYATADEARDAAQIEIDDYADDSGDGWSSEVDSVCWGEVKAFATERHLGPAPEGASVDYLSEYVLQPIDQPPTAGWCPECGPQTRVDEDGCCLTCGNGATGPGADAAVHALSEVERQKALDLASECDRLRRELAELQATGAEPASGGETP